MILEAESPSVPLKSVFIISQAHGGLWLPSSMRTLVVYFPAVFACSARKHLLSKGVLSPFR